MSDSLAIIRSLGALLTVLGCLAGALWAVRRFNLVLPGARFADSRRLAVVERLNLDPRRSLALIRRDDTEHLVLLAPEGNLVVESRIVGAASKTLVAPKPEARTVPANARKALPGLLGSDFGAQVERARQPLVRRQSTPLPKRHAAPGANRRQPNA